ncbi:protein BCL9 homolog [Diabrotica virgifera virgifera]|uniref:Protein BCL9 homolog n=1 Tax=Diabrotica virgifera virgifera TaxID=50390 RepID=A0A6P7G8H6_DIAVI|nr:protein BCL9 homolog [Diabrotica virgifera virgifera]
MIKEKAEKSSETTKDEAGSSDKETASTEVRVKKEEETSVKKEPCTGPITKNGGIVGSTNTGSLQTTLDRKPEVHSEDSLSVPGPDSSALPLKEECIDGELGGDAFGLGLPTTGGSSHSQPPEGVQPLVSNVINKQPNSMEVNYMQQQSQIFVFSTILANSGAEEVIQGRYPSIIAYHCAQPGTKKYLEKNPLKVTQFNRQNPAQWLSNIAMMKNKSCTRSPGLGSKPPTTLDNFLGPDPLDDMVGLDETNIAWDTKNNHLEGLDAAVSNGLPDVVPDMDACSPSLANVQPSLQGVKVPDENLTPQQRQHREVQLATIRKMQQMLFPESQSMEGVPGGAAGGNAPGAGSNVPADSNLPPGATPPSGQLEWQKLHQFYDDPKRKQGPGSVVAVGPVSGGSTGPNMPAGSGGPAVMPRGVPGPGPRLQGPPPPYHQTPRSASVPIALQSPNPTSPNNPTSNLSLPSPRASSALNSPADPNRPFGLSRHMSTGQSPTSQDSPSAPRLNHSNPSTPLSSHHLSPSVTSTEPTSTHQSTADGMFGRTLQSMAQQKQHISTSTTSCATTPTTGVVKEPNLMPVPSPQQIQYLNTFEGQELIIQKQPNTSLKEGNIISPPVLPTTMDSGFPVTSDLPHSRVSGSNTPTSMDVGPRFPPTPSEGCRFQIPSPHTPTAVTAGEKPPQRLPGASVLSPQTVPGPNSDPLKTDLFPTPSPHMMDVPRFPGPNASPGAKMGGGFVNLSPQAKPLDMPNYACVRGDNVPLNPNCTSTMSGNPKVSHFDPISSLAQMSQQLTNSVASSLNGQSNQGPPMMNFGSPSMHMMDMGGCHGMNEMDQGSGGMMGMPMQGPPHGFHPNSPMGPIRSLSPKLPGAFPNHMPMPRMIGRPPGPNPYNGANVQVKPNAPNTIQYLPAKSQVGQAPPPRGPPIVDFLTRITTPMNMMDAKMQPQNMQYFSSCGPNNGPMQGGPMPPHMGHMEGPMSQDGPIGPMSMGSHMGNGPGPMGGNMGMPAGMIPMMRGPMRPPMGMRMPQMVFNGPPGGAEPMFNPGPNMGNPSPQMFVSGPKGSPMGLGAPDASQPLPPSMGQNNSFKNSPFVCPTTADPNYAQQFHNFQQQLYATGTRSQMGGQAMGPGPGPPHMQQPPYYNPK